MVIGAKYRSAHLVLPSDVKANSSRGFNVPFYLSMEEYGTIKSHKDRVCLHLEHTFGKVNKYGLINTLNDEKV